MSARLIDALLRLSPRERRLLALAALLLPLGLAIALLLPLHERRQSAVTAHAEAEAMSLWLQGQIREKQALTRGNTPGQMTSTSPLSQPVPAPIGTSGLEQGLIAARLRPALSALSAETGGLIELRFDSVEFTALADWLSAAHPGWGYRIDRFRLEPQEQAPGRVAAWITLTPAES